MSVEKWLYNVSSQRTGPRVTNILHVATASHSQNVQPLPNRPSLCHLNHRASHVLESSSSSKSITFALFSSTVPILSISPSFLVITVQAIPCIPVLAFRKTNPSSPTCLLLPPHAAMLYSFVTAVALFSGAALAATGELGDAAITTDNVAGASYQAVLPNKNTTTIRGQITGTSNTNGTGVEFNINFYGLPDQSQGGPFSESSISTIVSFPRA